MRLPPNFDNLFSMSDDLLVQGFSKLSGKGVDKVMSQSETMKSMKIRELIPEEIFGHEIPGPRDIKDFVEENVEEMTHSLIESVSELIEPIENTVDQTFIYITGSMDEVANVMGEMGIDLPEGLDLLPGASELILGVRLLLDIKAVNNEFEGISTNKKTNIAAAKALVTMSKFGVTFTLTTLGAAAGGAGGGAVGGVGAIVGAPVGAISGGLASGYINKKIAPHAQEISYKLLNLEKEDLFYYKNKNRIDDLGYRLSQFKRNLNSLELT